MKFVAALLLFLAFALPASAAVTLSVDKPVYNLGDLIFVSYGISTDADIAGLTELTLRCSSKELKFYALPTSLMAGQSVNVAVPGLSASLEMAGSCFVDAEVYSFDNSLRIHGSTPKFNITRNIPVAAGLDESYMPGSQVLVSGTTHKSHNSRSTVSLTFLGDTYSAPVINNTFAYTIILPHDIATGSHELAFEVNDSFGNHGSLTEQLVVEPVASFLEISSAGAVRPGESLAVNVSMLDQAHASMQRQVYVELINSSGYAIVERSATTPASFAFDVPDGLAPGVYSLKASGEGLVKTSIAVVEPTERVSVSLAGSELTIANTGNVPYNNEFVINLSGTAADYQLSRHLSLEPGQAAVIDLSKEVPEDTYTISVPTAGKAIDAYIPDRRSPFRKTADFVGITGAAVGTGTPAIQFILSPIIIVAALLIIIFFFSRNRGKTASGNSAGYDKEIAALRSYIHERHDESQREAAKPELSRDEESVKRFMESIDKDKPLK
ncbi:hypothetical protein HYX10_02050 [Candidatus Woesearchaeota archaeon]|nr:hypothetical protein [Candidatus Woesearchaeota archaeon]